MLQLITAFPPAPVCHRQTGTNVIGHKRRDFHDKRVLRSKRADGLNRSYKVESVYRPLQVCETQTCIKNVLGFLGVPPLSSARKGKRVLGRKGNPCSERGFPFLPNKTERSKGNFPLKKKHLEGAIYEKTLFTA